MYPFSSVSASSWAATCWSTYILSKSSGLAFARLSSRPLRRSSRLVGGVALIPPLASRALSLPVLAVWSWIIFAANFLIAGLVALCSASLAAWISYMSLVAMAVTKPSAVTVVAAATAPTAPAVAFSAAATGGLEDDAVLLAWSAAGGGGAPFLLQAPSARRETATAAAAMWWCADMRLRLSRTGDDRRKRRPDVLFPS